MNVGAHKVDETHLDVNFVAARTQATSCSTLHELLEEEPSEIPR